MFPRFRFTLNNSTAGSLVISEPGGWDEAVLKLERNKEFHSLVEFYDQPLTFYGQSSNGNGGLDYIREIERSQGPDAQITILIEISDDDGVTYTDTVFDGLIDITSAKEIDFYKAEYGIIRNDFWQKFMNRKGTPVNLGASVDLDGNATTPIAASTLTMTSQSIRLNFERKTGGGSAEFQYSESTNAGTTSYLIWSNQLTVLDEITDRFDYGTQISSEDPTTSDKYIFKVLNDGSYALDLSIVYSITFAGSRTYDIKWYYSYLSAGTLNTTQIGSTDAGTASSVTQATPKTASPTLSLLAGDEIYVYAVMTLNSASATTTYFADFDNDPGAGEDFRYTAFSVVADTTYANTTANHYLIGNAAKAILSKLTGVYPTLTSDYLNTPGCGAYYSITKGLYVRGYNTTDRPFYMSFDDWWKGANPILNLGLGYVNGADEIEIEQKSEFYDPVPVLNLDYVNNIERSWDTDLIFKTIEVGYEKWSAESGSGVDDPQTKRTFRTRFKTVGTDIRLLSKFYAASLGIEQTRRNRIEQGKDWRLDEDLMIIAVKTSDTNIPEVNGQFTSVSGIITPGYRYNLRITATRNMLRWKSFLQGCLKWYDSGDDNISFASGEGNFLNVFTTLVSTDCEYDLYDEGGLIGHQVGEAADLDAGAGHDFLFVPIIYEFEYPLTWPEYKAIQAYRKKAIGVSRTNANHVACFIMSLEYQITKGKAKFTVLLGQSEAI